MLGRTRTRSDWLAGRDDALDPEALYRQEFCKILIRRRAEDVLKYVPDEVRHWP
jgi:hypothetical protein